MKILLNSLVVLFSFLSGCPLRPLKTVRGAQLASYRKATT